ncbi:MMPL family transporter [Solwaraspora sp. WMMA2056]|uniref:MMPL family transporter n=1 Tax=Solwaraspora sp. WMMA2056 TaxID=3015161 RepID=UPI00259B9B5A|nr:MMPL family transporter [Solwaraspora sp. WMMA2056]WJK39244.1 MMPL family transporter [Solwaraspora sp. WMMA2056]
MLLLLALVGGLAARGSALTDEFTIPSSESQAALNVLQEEFPSAGGTSLQILLEAPDGGTVSDPAYTAAVQRSLTAVSKIDHVRAVAPPQAPGTVSADGRSGLAIVQFDVLKGELPDSTGDDVRAAMAPAEQAGLTVLLGGNALSGGPSSASHAAEVIGLLLAVVVLAVTLGSVVAAGLPLLTALVGVAAGLVGIWVASTLTTISTTAPTLALMLGLAVGIDYALLLVVRHRAELAAGADVAQAVARATATAGSSVVFAGSTVIIALLGLAVAQVPFLTVMGVSSAATVLLAVLVAITLLPALLSVAGRRLAPRPGGRDSRRATAVAEGRAVPGAERWVRGVLRRPVVILAAGVGALLVLAVPVTGMRLALPDNGSLPNSDQARQVYDTVSDEFGPGLNGPVLVLADLSRSSQPDTAATAVAEGLSDIPGVASVAPPRISADARYALIQVIPATGPADPATADVVQTIRHEAADITATTGATIQVSGTTALGVDVSARLLTAILPFALVVVGLSMVLLTMVFRSLLVPLIAAVGYLLTLGATLGVTVVLFQWGWLGGILSDGATGSLVSFMPIIVMAVLFGLAMDYQVFLVSRIHEAVIHGREPREAVREGARHAGRVVAAAALIMIGVFASFVVSGTATVRPIAFALALGVLLDAFLVRMTLVPAALGLLGTHAWTLPHRLDRLLPAMDVEGVALDRPADGDAAGSVEGHTRTEDDITRAPSPPSGSDPDPDGTPSPGKGSDRGAPTSRKPSSSRGGTAGSTGRTKALITDLSINSIREVRMPTRPLAAMSVTVIAALVGCLAVPSGAQATASTTTSGIDAYLYGYAPVVAARTRANQLCAIGNVNTLASSPELTTPASRDVVAPNVDTLYSIAWLDLRRGPVVLTVPAIDDRYYNFQFLDMYTNVFTNIGTSTVDPAGGRYAIVPPGWSGELPTGVTSVSAPTWDVWLLGRTLVKNPDDVSAAWAVMAGYQLAVLETPATGTPPPLPTPDCANLPRPQTPYDAGAAFFDELAAVLAADPPPAADAPALAGLAALSVEPGGNPSQGDPQAVATLEAAVTDGQAYLAAGHAEAAFPTAGRTWRSSLSAGTYGTDYLLRAGIAAGGLGANVPAESTYYFSQSDLLGQPLSGEHSYRLHFRPGALPPTSADGFWSVTMYDENYFLVPNELNRYALSDRSALTVNQDGSLDLFLSTTPPPGGTANWLPAPTGTFHVYMRVYLPTDDVLTGEWQPPRITRWFC